MKSIEELTVAVIDYGTFESAAEMFGRVCEKCYLYTPFEDEFRDIKRCAIGDGLEYVERLNEPLNPDIFDTIDLWVFLDIGFGGFQRFLRSRGKIVWGSMGADSFELFRTKFYDTVKELGLPVIKTVPIVGLTNLVNHLKTVKNKWVKVNRFRANMETWKHEDMAHSIRKLEAMAVDFGGMAEQIVFVVQDVIDSDVEIGFDGWTIDGQYPSSTFQGYERKNELYLGSLLDYDKLPEPVRMVNKKFSQVFRDYEYRNFMATEIRMKGKIPYFIDPTFRLPGQTGEHLFTTCKNLPEVMWNGANGIVVKPEWLGKFALEATMHYTGDCEAWKVLRVPEEIEEWVKLYHYCMVDGLYHFPTRKTNEVGVVCGVGDSIPDAFKNLMLNFSKLKDEPVEIESEEFAHLLKQVDEAERHGIEFTSQAIPKPEIALEAV